MNLFEYTYDLVRQIPKGKISSYGSVARALGDIRASRAVGRMMNQNPDADDMPCFKIVHSDGRLGGFGLGIDDKIRRLNKDNIVVKDSKIIDFENVLFEDFKTDYPLKKLRQEQIELSKKVKTRDDFEEIVTVAGIDVAYPMNEFDDACGTCVIVDYKTEPDLFYYKPKIVEEKTVFAKTEFPYIPTYLSYREIPIIKKLFESLDTKPSIIMFDGNGILHPYGCGLASHCGVLLDTPSIGVAKSLLPVKSKEKKSYNLISGRAKKPIYISPGHKVSLDTSVSVVRHLCRYKIPEPLRLAHMLSKKGLIERR
ncbi:MAG: endonuclease V [Thermoplasmatales archaeon]|nr:MAG: endonuclease V [Thermoplasmatales archaeon]